MRLCGGGELIGVFVLNNSSSKQLLILVCYPWVAGLLEQCHSNIWSATKNKDIESGRYVAR